MALHLSARGCAHRATLGAQENGTNPEKVFILRLDRFNPFRVASRLIPKPRVARASQPWAEGWSTFGARHVFAQSDCENRIRISPRMGRRRTGDGRFQRPGGAHPHGNGFRWLPLAALASPPANFQVSLRDIPPCYRSLHPSTPRFTERSRCMPRSWSVERGRPFWTPEASW